MRVLVVFYWCSFCLVEFVINFLFEDFFLGLFFCVLFGWRVNSESTLEGAAMVATQNQEEMEENDEERDQWEGPREKLYQWEDQVERERESSAAM